MDVLPTSLSLVTAQSFFSFSLRENEIYLVFAYLSVTKKVKLMDYILAVFKKTQ